MKEYGFKICLAVYEESEKNEDQVRYLRNKIAKDVASLLRSSGYDVDNISQHGCMPEMTVYID